MPERAVSLVVRTALGMLLILNGPANAFAVAVVSSQCACGEAKQKAKKCCGRCGACRAPSAPAPQKSDSIRPTCPKCPTCPNYPGNCCVSCPNKAPCAPQQGFVLPALALLERYLPAFNFSLCESHPDELIVPPRCEQFVAFII